MAEIDVQAIADALAVNARTVAGNIQIVPFFDDQLPADTSWLAGEIGLKSGENTVNIERAASIDTWILHMELGLYLADVDPEAAQTLMLAFVGLGGASSMWNALESDLTLGGLAQKTITRRSHSYAAIQRAGSRLIMNHWDVDVWAST